MKFYIIYKNTRVPKTPSFRALFPVKPTMSSPASTTASKAAAHLALVRLNQNLTQAPIFGVTDDGVLCVIKKAGEKTLVCALANCSSFPKVFEQLGVLSLPQMAKEERRYFCPALRLGNECLERFVVLFNAALPEDQRPKSFTSALNRVPPKDWVKSVTDRTVSISGGAGSIAVGTTPVSGGPGACVSMTVSEDDDVDIQLKSSAELFEKDPIIDSATAAADAAIVDSICENSEWTISSGEDIASPIEGFLEGFYPLAVSLLKIDAAVQMDYRLRDSLPRALVISARVARLACYPLSNAVVFKKAVRAARLKAELTPPSPFRESLIDLAKAAEMKATGDIDLHVRALNDMIHRYSVPRINSAVQRNIVNTVSLIEAVFKVE
jgi:hypothetical protein